MLTRAVFLLRLRDARVSSLFESSLFEKDTERPLTEAIRSLSAVGASRLDLPGQKPVAA